MNNFIQKTNSQKKKINHQTFPTKMLSSIEKLDSIQRPSFGWFHEQIFINIPYYQKFWITKPYSSFGLFKHLFQYFRFFFSIGFSWNVPAKNNKHSIDVRIRYTHFGIVLLFRRCSLIFMLQHVCLRHKRLKINWIA